MRYTGHYTPAEMATLQRWLTRMRCPPIRCDKLNRLAERMQRSPAGLAGKLRKILADRASRRCGGWYMCSWNKDGACKSPYLCRHTANVPLTGGQPPKGGSPC